MHPGCIERVHTGPYGPYITFRVFFILTLFSHSFNCLRLFHPKYRNGKSEPNFRITRQHLFYRTKPSIKSIGYARAYNHLKESTDREHSKRVSFEALQRILQRSLSDRRNERHRISARYLVRYLSHGFVRFGGNVRD